MIELEKGKYQFQLFDRACFQIGSGLQKIEMKILRMKNNEYVTEREKKEIDELPNLYNVDWNEMQSYQALKNKNTLEEGQGNS